MRYSGLVCVGLILTAAGCAGVNLQGFGPYPSSFLASGLTTGVASFGLGTGSGANEFSIVVVSTDPAGVHQVTVVVDGGAPTILSVAPCQAATAKASCSATTVTVSLTMPGGAAPVVVTITPDCLPRVYYITTVTSPTGSTFVLDPIPPTTTACGDLSTLPQLLQLLGQGT